MVRQFKRFDAILHNWRSAGVFVSTYRLATVTQVCQLMRRWLLSLLFSSQEGSRAESLHTLQICGATLFSKNRPIYIWKKIKIEANSAYSTKRSLFPSSTFGWLLGLEVICLARRIWVYGWYAIYVGVKRRTRIGYSSRSR